MPLAIRIVVALALPLVAALTVAGTYLGLEIIVGAAWVALATGTEKALHHTSTVHPGPAFVPVGTA